MTEIWKSDGRPLIDEWDSLDYLLMMMKRMLTLRVEKLVCLRLANMSRMTKDFTERGKRKNLVMALRGFISNQRQLRVLNLSCAGLNLQHVYLIMSKGSEVIAKAGRNCGSKIKKLIIDDLFSMDNDDDDFTDQLSTVLLEPLRCYTGLTSLACSYQTLSPEILNVFATSGVLKLLRVYVVKVMDPGHMTTGDWENLQASCPQLEAHFICMNAIDYQTFWSMMIPGIPLTLLRWTIEGDFLDKNWSEETLARGLFHLSRTLPSCANIETVSIGVPEKTEKAIEFKKLLMHNIVEYSSGRTDLKEFLGEGFPCCLAQ